MQHIYIAWIERDVKVAVKKRKKLKKLKHFEEGQIIRVRREWVYDFGVWCVWSTTFAWWYRLQTTPKAGGWMAVGKKGVVSFLVGIGAFSQPLETLLKHILLKAFIPTVLLASLDRVLYLAIPWTNNELALEQLMACGGFKALVRVDSNHQK